MIACRKSTKWWLTVATGGAEELTLGGYGLATVIHGTNSQQSVIQQTATMPGALSRDKWPGCRNGMPPQDGGPVQNGHTSECRLKTVSSLRKDKSRILLLSKMTTGRKTRKVFNEHK